MAKYIGAHVSAAGGVQNTPLEAAKIGAKAFALFTGYSNRWSSKPISAERAEQFKENCRAHGYDPSVILPHDNFLINLGSPDDQKLATSRKSFLESINLTLEATTGVTAVLESTAGQGTNLGFRFEHLAHIIDKVEDKSRIGVCIDTCHSHSAGYDLATEEGYRETWEAFDRIIGGHYLRAVHLNDNKRTLGSRVDRHELIGKGSLGEEFFRRLVNDPRFEEVPLILETPDPSRWPEEIAWLYSIQEKSAR